jgi:hypothetical protein
MDEIRDESAYTTEAAQRKRGHAMTRRSDRRGVSRLDAAVAVLERLLRHAGTMNIRGNKSSPPVLQLSGTGRTERIV